MKDKILNEIVNNSIELIRYRTIKNNYEEFEKVFEFVKNELSNYYIREVYVNNYKNLIISNTKDKDLDIIFCGHMDVVPCDKYEGILKDDKLYGRGSFDMKSQVSVMMSVLKNNKSSKKIALIITSDEEIGGMCCKEILKEYNSKLAIIPDASKNFKLITEEKGLLQLEIETYGVTAHASEPFKGENAILKSMNIFNKLLEYYKMPSSEDEFITSVNLSKIEGGNATNCVADFCKMTLDIRFTNDVKVDDIISKIKEIDSESNIKVLDQDPAFYVDENLIKEFINNAKDILGELEIGKCLATSDAIYFSEKNIPVVLINPIGDYLHNPKEYVEVDSLYTLYNLFKSML